MSRKKGIQTHQELLCRLMICEERYQNFMNAATDSIFINNLSGLILDANTAACNALGYTYKEIINLHVWDIEIGFSKDTIEQITLKLIDGPFNVEGRHKRKDGTSFPVDVRMSAFTSMGEPLVLAIVRDITEQKSAESTIRRFTYALEKIPSLVVITDNNGTIEYINTKVTELTGYFYYEILGQNSRILQSGKTPIEIYESMWGDIIHGKTWHGEFLNMSKKGEYYWVSATISPLRDERDKEITHYLAIMEPIFKKRII